MIHVKNAAEANKYKISTRLLMLEALRKGYVLAYYPSGPSTESGITRGEKDGKEIFFRSTCALLTPSLGVLAAENKCLTGSMLSSFGVNTPEIIALTPGASLDNAQMFLKKYKKVVVKPSTTNHGDGVSIGIDNMESLARAVEFAFGAGGPETDVIIQQQVYGNEYRFLVVAGKVVAVSSRRPPFVTGDGKTTIEGLIKNKNQDPRRGTGHTNELSIIDVNDVLHHKGEAFLQSIPPKGIDINVLDTSNLSRGGEAIDYTDRASRALKKMAVAAADACFLGIAGVDIITNDITAETQRGSFVIEVNLTPGLRMHQFPSEGQYRDVAKLVFNAIEKTARPIGKKVTHVGRASTASLPEVGVGALPVRIDTGAAVSSLWASKIEETAEGLSFSICAEGSKYYTGEKITVAEYSKRAVSSSMGHTEIRYLVRLLVVLKGRRIRAAVTLADRSTQVYPMLVGRNILRNKFVVDVATGNAQRNLEQKKRKMLNQLTKESK